MNNKKIAFIGTGNMASAIINGILKSGSFKSENILLFDVMPEKARAFTSCTAMATIKDAVDGADYVVFAIKPQNYEDALDSINAAQIKLAGKTFISIAAGINTDYICKKLNFDASVVRIMPNTPLLIGEGVSAVCKNKNVSDDEFKTVFSLFSSLGYAFELGEDKMNEIIALNGSSPAYVFLFIKALCEGAKKQGIEFEDEKELRNIACKAVIGSALLMLNSDKSADELIRMVTSPKGTTEKAMEVFYANNLEKTVEDAMQKCTDRAYELSK